MVRMEFNSEGQLRELASQPQAQRIADAFRTICCRITHQCHRSDDSQCDCEAQLVETDCNWSISGSELHFVKEKHLDREACALDNIEVLSLND